MVVVKMMILDYPICRVVFHVEKLKRVPSCIVGESAITFSIPRPPFFFLSSFFPFPFFSPGDRNYGRAIQVGANDARISRSFSRSVSRSAGDFRSLIFPRTRAHQGRSTRLSCTGSNPCGHE